jgi:hypothetical protein
MNIESSKTMKRSAHVTLAASVEGFFDSFGSSQSANCRSLNLIASKEVSYLCVRSFFVIIFVVLIVFPTGVLFASGMYQKDDDWRYLGTTKEDIKLFYSPERTVRQAGLIQSWFKAVYPDSDKKISYSIALHEFNCRDGNYRLLQGTLYFRDGSARSDGQASPWVHPLPDSLAEIELRHICNPTSRRPKNVR